jgi:hypothetical protein
VLKTMTSNRTYLKINENQWKINENLWQSISNHGNSMNSGRAFLGASVLQATDGVLHERILPDLRDRTISVTVLENHWSQWKNHSKTMKTDRKSMNNNENQWKPYRNPYSGAPLSQGPGCLDDRSKDLAAFGEAGILMPEPYYPKVQDVYRFSTRVPKCSRNAPGMLQDRLRVCSHTSTARGVGGLCIQEAYAIPPTP